MNGLGCNEFLWMISGKNNEIAIPWKSFSEEETIYCRRSKFALLQRQKTGCSISPRTLIMNIGDIIAFALFLIIVVMGFLLSFYLLRHKR